MDWLGGSNAARHESVQEVTTASSGTCLAEEGPAVAGMASPCEALCYLLACNLRWGQHGSLPRHSHFHFVSEGSD